MDGGARWSARRRSRALLGTDLGRGPPDRLGAPFRTGRSSASTPQGMAQPRAHGEAEGGTAAPASVRGGDGGVRCRLGLQVSRLGSPRCGRPPPAPGCLRGTAPFKGNRPWGAGAARAPSTPPPGGRAAHSPPSAAADCLHSFLGFSLLPLFTTSICPLPQSFLLDVFRMHSLSAKPSTGKCRHREKKGVSLFSLGLHVKLTSSSGQVHSFWLLFILKCTITKLRQGSCFEDIKSATGAQGKEKRVASCVGKVEREVSGHVAGGGAGGWRRPAGLGKPTRPASAAAALPSWCMKGSRLWEAGQDHRSPIVNRRDEGREHMPRCRVQLRVMLTWHLDPAESLFPRESYPYSSRGSSNSIGERPKFQAVWISKYLKGLWA